MIQPIQIRNVEIGSGVPKVIVPIVGKTEEAILAKAGEIASMPIHTVEWRVDFYDDVFDTEKTLATLKKLRCALGTLPLLFTFRTKKEGGEKEITMEQYTALNLAVAASGDADLIDVEIFSGDGVVKANIDGHPQGGRACGWFQPRFLCYPGKGRYCFPPAQDAGDGRGHSENRRNAQEHCGRAHPACRNGRNA